MQCHRLLIVGPSRCMYSGYTGAVNEACSPAEPSVVAWQGCAWQCLFHGNKLCVLQDPDFICWCFEFHSYLAGMSIECCRPAVHIAYAYNAWLLAFIATAACTSLFSCSTHVCLWEVSAQNARSRSVPAWLSSVLQPAYAAQSGSASPTNAIMQRMSHLKHSHGQHLRQQQHRTIAGSSCYYSRNRVGLANKASMYDNPALYSNDDAVRWAAAPHL